MGTSRPSGELDPVLVNRNPQAAGFDNSSKNGVSGTNFSADPFWLGESLAAPVRPTIALQTEVPQGPKASFANLMASAR